MRSRFLALLFAPVLALGLAACDVDQREEADLPDVDVEGGQLPEYDVDAPDIDVNRDTVTVPDVDVNPDRERR